MEGRRQPLNCLVDYVSFSAHVDFVQNRDFITRVNPRNIILVHGAKEEMGRLKGALMMHYNKLPEVCLHAEILFVPLMNMSVAHSSPYDQSLRVNAEQEANHCHAAK